MVKRILTFSFFIAVACGLSIKAEALTDRGVSQFEQFEERGINIVVNGSALTISGADGKVLEVVSLTGRKVATIKIENPSQRVELNIPKGCYILKIGSVVRKVSIC